MLGRVVNFLVFSIMSAAAADTTKVTVFDEEFRRVRVIASERELAMFDEFWSGRVIAGPEAALKPLYKLDIERKGRSSRWLYDPAGLV